MEPMTVDRNRSLLFLKLPHCYQVHLWIWFYFSFCLFFSFCFLKISRFSTYHSSSHICTRVRVFCFLFFPGDEIRKHCMRMRHFWRHIPPEKTDIASRNRSVSGSSGGRRRRDCGGGDVVSKRFVCKYVLAGVLVTFSFSRTEKHRKRQVFSKYFSNIQSSTIFNSFCQCSEIPSHQVPYSALKTQLASQYETATEANYIDLITTANAWISCSLRSASWLRILQNLTSQRMGSQKKKKTTKKHAHISIFPCQ